MKIVEGKKIYTVSEVNYFARLTLEEMVFWIEAEISRCDKSPGYNFYYLTLKDEYAILPAIADGFIIDGLTAEPLGQKVLIYGNLTLYEPRGQYQFKIYKIETIGEGLLQKKLLEIILKLKKEGLFDPKHKKEIPLYPKKTCVITSYGSDAWNDFKRHTVDKFPIIELYVADVRVQGPQSIEQLLGIIPMVDNMNFDVVVITRGGGSLEDLAAFNEEKVARAIFKMKTPIIVAIGHEANEAVAEWAADKRASTPTDAANLVTQSYSRALERLAVLKQQLKLKTDYYFSSNFQRLDYYFLGLQNAKNTFKDLPHLVNTLRESLKRHQKHLIVDAQLANEEFLNRIKKQAKMMIANKQDGLSALAKTFLLLSPQNTLKRGYAIAQDEGGKVLKSIKSVVLESTVGVILNDGSLKTQVKVIERDGQKFRQS